MMRVGRASRAAATAATRHASDVPAWYAERKKKEAQRAAWAAKRREQIEAEKAGRTTTSAGKTAPPGANPTSMAEEEREWLYKAVERPVDQPYTGEEARRAALSLRPLFGPPSTIGDGQCPPEWERPVACAFRVLASYDGWRLPAQQRDGKLMYSTLEPQKDENFLVACTTEETYARCPLPQAATEQVVTGASLAAIVAKISAEIKPPLAGLAVDPVARTGVMEVTVAVPSTAFATLCATALAQIPAERRVREYLTAPDAAAKRKCLSGLCDVKWVLLGKRFSSNTGVHMHQDADGLLLYAAADRAYGAQAGLLEAGDGHYDVALTTLRDLATPVFDGSASPGSVVDQGIKLVCGPGNEGLSFPSLSAMVAAFESCDVDIRRSARAA